MNLTEWAHTQGIHVTTAYRWPREGTLPVPTRKAGRLILVFPGTTATGARRGGAGLYARVSSHDQRADLSSLAGEVTGDLARDMGEVLVLFCARLYGRRLARSRAVKALGSAQRGIGPQAAVGLRGGSG